MLDHPAARLLSTPPHTLTPPHPMTTYRIEGVHADGRYVSHLVQAADAVRAIQAVGDQDNQIIRVTRAIPAS